MSSRWVLEVQNDIYTIVKTRVKNAMAGKFPNLLFVQRESLPDDAEFPAVYIHFVGSYEVGGDLVGVDTLGIQCNAEFKVISAQTQGVSVANEIAARVIDEFKKLGFKLNTVAELGYQANGTIVYVGRVRRVIGAGDKII